MLIPRSLTFNCIFYICIVVQKKSSLFRKSNVADISRALVRAGRFDSRVTVPMPDVRARKSILELHLGKVQLADGKNIVNLFTNNDAMLNRGALWSCQGAESCFWCGDNI